MEQLEPVNGSISPHASSLIKFSPKQEKIPELNL